MLHGPDSGLRWRLRCVRRSLVRTPDVNARPRGWPRLFSLLAVLVWLVLTGCAGAHQRFVAATPYAEAPLPPRAKIFLVAGGVDVANFAAEVVAQRQLWLERGFSADEIVCYWAQPGRAAFRADRAQYRQLAADLRPCYPASTALLRQHLRQVAQSPPEFLYLYITSHGDPDIMPVGVPLAQLLPSEVALFDQYVIQLGAGVGRGVSPAALALAVRRGQSPDDLVLSPRVLQHLLQALPAATPKFVVLQACHSGGFLADPRPARQAATLAHVPNVLAIAAARFDRTSFGCDAGETMTYFGSVYTQLLGEHSRGLTSPTAIAWPTLFHQLAAEIATREQALGVTPSLPMLLLPSAHQP